MKWSAQVFHVARKDMLRTKWMLLAYVVVVAVATVGALGPESLELYNTTRKSFFLMCVIAMFIVITVIQEDSPAQSAPFWALHPLSPSAVYGGKMVGALSLVGVALVGQLLTLIALDVPAVELAELLAASAVLYGCVLLATALVASVTRDLRGFAIAIVSVVVALMLIRSTPPIARRLDQLIELAYSFRSGGITAVAVAVSVTLTSMLIVLHQYTTRRVLRGALLAIGCGAIAWFVLSPLFSAVKIQTSDLRAAVLPDSLHPNTVQVSDTVLGIGFQGRDREQLAIRVHALPADSVNRVALRVNNVRLRYGDGRVRRVSHRHQYVILFEPDVRPGPDVTLIGPPGWRGAEFNLVSTIQTEQLDKLRPEEATLEISGWVEVLKPQIRGAPVRSRGALDAPGVRSDAWFDDRDVAMRSFVVRNVGIGSAATRLSTEKGWYRYLLVNDREKEAISLYSKSVSSVTNDWEGLLLPTSKWRRTSQFVERPLTKDMDAQLGIDNNWISGAHMAIVDWVPLGRYPVNFEAKVRRPAS